MIEYSDTGLEKDLQLKPKIYARASVPEYWVVNLRIRELIVLRDPAGDDYQSRLVVNSGLIYPISFPAIGIEVTKLIR